MEKRYKDAQLAAWLAERTNNDSGDRGAEVRLNLYIDLAWYAKDRGDFPAEVYVEPKQWDKLVDAFGIGKSTRLDGMQGIAIPTPSGPVTLWRTQTYVYVPRRRGGDPP